MADTTLTLCPGERILLSRAIGLYIKHYDEQRLLHKGDDYNRGHDEANIAAATALSDKIMRRA